jgi:cation transport ATPase
VTAVLVVAPILGWTDLQNAAVLHERSTLVVVGKELRLLAWRGAGCRGDLEVSPT